MPDDGTNPYIYHVILTFAAPVRVAYRPCGDRPRARGARHHLCPRGSRLRAAARGRQPLGLRRGRA
eukprot:4434904-Prymnesium_polylepis.1